MISLSSVWAITLRHLRTYRRDPNALLGGFYWPLLDVLTWGFLGTWVQQTAHFKNYELVALLGLLLWQVVGRGGNFIAIALCEELWSRNLVNLFSLPLRTTEWIAGIVLLYGILMTLTFLVCMTCILLLYNVALWDLLSTFLLFMPPLIFSAIWVGFTCLQIIITMGRRGVELGFVFVWFLQPFCGAYYPIEVLPAWGQMIANFLPMSYVFQGMRGYVMHQQDPLPYILKGYALGIPYAVCAILMFIYCFNRSKQKGLTRLVE